jgi:hypothetical protein
VNFALADRTLAVQCALSVKRLLIVAAVATAGTGSLLDLLHKEDLVLMELLVE